ncbi:MAG TPA: copper homeostasis protein CutC [Rhodanobacteraceae bacterium]|nr:copper homeostasis protein CutC [Rhodanobacteraceae bacterium]
MSDAILEVAANSVASACAAQAGGAARVELCAALEVGGLTPSHAMIAMAREKLDIAVYVLIRPRAGDFVYSELEIETMRRDIDMCAALGCDGVVVGALHADGVVDPAACRILVAAAGNMGVTFHRAFDLVPDQHAALEDIVALGCERILTSGGQSDAVAGAARIRELVEQAGERLVVMPGAGVNSGNVAALARATGAREFHASAKRMLPSRFRIDTSFVDMRAGESRTDEAEVRALVAALESTEVDGA